MIKNYTQFTNYHRVLRVALVVCALMLVFDSGIISESTSKLSNGTQSYLANSIGMTASVAPTELNQLTAKLTEKEQELSSREAALREREIAIGLNESGESDYSTYILASVLFILLVLILLNYVLDYLRSKERLLAP